MGSNKDSDDIRQYLPDLESIRREADPEVAERKLRQAQNNPELDRALSEMQQQKPTGQPLFQFPVVPALAKERTGPPPYPAQAVPPPYPAQAAPPPYPGTAAQHGAVAPPGAAAQQHGAMATQRVPVYAGEAAPPGAPVQQQGAPRHPAAPVHPGATTTQRVPVYAGAAAPQRAPVEQQGAPAQPGAMAPSQWADRALPPIDKALLPSSLLPVTPPPVAVPKAPAATPATGQRRPWMPTWLIVLLALVAVSSPFVLSTILRRETPPKAPEPAPPSSGTPTGSTQAPPEASERLPPVAPAPPEAVEPSLDDTAAEREPPAPEATAPHAPAPQAPARPARPAPHRPQTPVAPAPTHQNQLADDVME
ncbi:hypothetical protein WME76_03860 [Sorangium sp. So ce119]|uniref:hypothetical protein n=1 Tax=Sorangium sp. So ce119 TaxID=3133279 RepID=UPI003F5F7C14